METKQPDSTGQADISTSLDANLEWARQTFLHCQDVAVTPFQFGKEKPQAAFSVYCQSLVEESRVHFMRSALEGWVRQNPVPRGEASLQEEAALYSSQEASEQPLHIFRERADIEYRVWQGYVIVFMEGCSEALGYQSAPLEKRKVTEPVSEPVVQGPREGTVECLDTNLGMIRQRIKSSKLKVEFMEAGPVMKTTVAYAYLDEVVNTEVLQEFKKRLGTIKDYEVLETAYVEDWVQDSVWSPFPQLRYTERTDAAAAALLDGKILVLVANSPSILICPALFVDFFNTSEDYYIRTVYATMVRMLRLLAFFIALTLPSFYVALSTFHPELIPTVLLLTIMDTREGIPFPAFFEALIMEISFELLREAGIRLPRPVGSAVSIVGALVIGQAAIMAKISSPIMVIVVAFTGIASFAIPHYDMGIAIRVLRFPYMILAGLLGGFGLMIGFLLTLLHLTCLHSLGQPYLSSLAPLKLRDLRDVFIRVPLRTLLRSPRNRLLHSSSAGPGQGQGGLIRTRTRRR
jgi:spore germination protein